MTAEEADARFAALVAEARGPRKAKKRSAIGDGYPAVAMLVVYLAGVMAGAVWHAKVGTAVVLGVLVFLVRWGYAKYSRAGDA